MRTPDNLSYARPPHPRRRLRRWLIGIAIVLVVLIASISSLASIYTDGLWFSSVGYHNVFSTLLWIKLGLFGSFGAIFFVVLWVNLVICDRLSDEVVSATHEDEVVRRYQQIVRPYSGRVYVVLAFVLALIAASGTIGEWQNWILFRHGGNFAATDPQFHKNVGFYVFKLPFLTFVVDWVLAILIVTLVVSAVFHYFNGGIRPQRGIPRVGPAVKAHLSVLLALIALTKAAGYILQRWSEVNAQDGYVNGAGYTDVHARLPAQTLLIIISIFAAAILLYNIRRQGWTLPILAVGYLGLRGPGGRGHLPGPPANPQGQPGPGLTRGAVHSTEHRRHPGRLQPQSREDAELPSHHQRHGGPSGPVERHPEQHQALGP